MAIASKSRSKFITTEPLGKSGQKGEQQVWDAIQKAFVDRECIAYWRYPIFSQVGKSRKEPDILIADRQLGLIIIEVKSIAIEQIVSIAGHLWQLQNFYTDRIRPYEQAENQLFALLGYSDREPTLRRRVNGRAIVALPKITQTQWQQKSFDRLPSCPPILFQEYLQLERWGDGEMGRWGERAQRAENKNKFIPYPLVSAIEATGPVIQGEELNDEQWELLLAILGGAPVFRQRAKKPVSLPNAPPQPGTRAWVILQARSQLSKLDWQQELIGKQIPPGPQRIRGIAGAGKTVLLCQKIAHMHLKHPDWDLALVFFSRSLYDAIASEVDKWLRRFSSGEVGYDPTNPKLKVLHAWGAKNRPGLYSTICEAANIPRRTVYDTDSKLPNEALAEVCSQLLQDAVIPQIFDAIAIDEGQDLIVDDRLKFQGKQPFYWMAYQALRPVESRHPERRRLIWAYDEAQSLESLSIPTASELFGDELGHLVTGQYTDGIAKSEIIRRCYRTPGPILTAAQAMGMGLLRPGGAISGMTRTEDWQAIGYEVTGRLTRGQEITLRWLPENSPNPIPQLWAGELIELETYQTRQEELTALATNIRHNLERDGLQPSQEILVVVLGSYFEAMNLETQVASFLIAQGINIFIPGTSAANILQPDPENRNPNKFWCDRSITVSRIHRAKGNEAEMVYIVGLDNVAKNESNITLRNQLFVALTRSKAWVKLSGIGKYSLYEEMRRVINSGDTFTFTYNRQPRREINVTDGGELLRRYAAGQRNFQGGDFRGIQLAGANLSGANLIGAQLNDADLSRANLDRAKLAIADLSNSNLSHASLQKAKLMGASLQNARLYDADLSRADLSDADLSDAQLVGAKLVGTNLNNTDLSRTDLTDAQL
ncbi:MAG: pentapeptide repeat-containing protein [Cyanosarcina radialis HA8281-LM2]|jgi:superfamily I DNA and RNA helicase|nr:pentapeptide repeat-containing protein [Cyanosarcina radialis HA8281-LM2]